jgi:hypothetical protein
MMRILDCVQVRYQHAGKYSNMKIAKNHSQIWQFKKVAYIAKRRADCNRKKRSFVHFRKFFFSLTS